MINLSSLLGNSFSRFPVSIFFGICFALYGVYSIQSEDLLEYGPNISIFCALIFGYFCSLALSFFVERKGLSKLVSILISSISIPLSVGYYFLFPSNVNEYLFFDGLTHVIIIGSLLSLAFLLGFWKTTNEKPNGLLYFYQAIKKGKGAFLMAFFYGLIAFLGILFFFTALDFLFDINVDEDWYGYIFFTIAGVLSSTLFLGSLPRPNEKFDYTPSKWLEILGQYILLPLSIGYAGLLFAYIIKILITGIWPEGFISWFILGFSFVGISAFSVLIPKIQKSKIIGLMARIFGFSLIPSSIILGMALWIRVSEYGITEPRYLVGILSLCLFISGIWLMISKRFDIRFPLALFSGMLFLSTFGFWGAESIAIKSQMERLESYIEGEGIEVPLGNNKLTEKQKEDLQKQFIFFLIRNKTNLVYIFLPVDIRFQISERLEVDIDNQEYIMGNWNVYTIGSSIDEYLNTGELEDIGKYRSRNSYSLENRSVYRSGIRLDKQAIDVSGYTYIQQFSNYIGVPNETVSIQLSDDTFHNIDFINILESLSETSEPLLDGIKYSDDTIEGLIYFTSYHKNSANYDFSGYILWKEK